MAREKKRDAKTSLRGLLEGVVLPPPPKKRAPAPPPAKRASERLAGDDRVVWEDAMIGVRPLAAKTVAKKASPKQQAMAQAIRARGSGADEEARARLAALVASGIRFHVEREGACVVGWRAGTPERTARELAGRGGVPEATLDLHGQRAEDAVRAVVKFVRACHRKGMRRLCVVHGKGLHSEGGVGVLGDRVVRALTDGGAAPVVQAFATAPSELGGAGALLVQLTRR